MAPRKGKAPPSREYRNLRSFPRLAAKKTLGKFVGRKFIKNGGNAFLPWGTLGKIETREEIDKPGGC